MHLEIPGPPNAANDWCRRASRRRRAFHAAVLAECQEGTAHDCLIRDIGVSGAQLRLNFGHRVAQNAHLVDLMSRNAYPVIRIWQQGTRAGVSFEGSSLVGTDFLSAPSFLDRLFVLGKLRQIAQLSAQGLDVTTALKACAVSRESYRQWRETFAL